MTRLILSLAALSMIGCGQSDSEKVEQTFRDFFGALADGDADKGCALMTEDAKTDLVADLHRYSLTKARPTTCRSAFVTYSGLLRPEGRRVATRVAEGGEVRVTIAPGGDTARAHHESGRQVGDEVRFTKTHGTWLLDSGPGTPSG